ncbi:MAG: LysM peptidoglycan-binding domain-containing protein [Chloroflexi bacterium]|nr:MAG: LysM peptidoglycan-binding domain-containing protein [Chloroflexota bacterium]
MKSRFLGLFVVLAALTLTRCVLPAPQDELWRAGNSNNLSSQPPIAAATPLPATFLPPTREPGTPIQSPTPDAQRFLPTLRVNEEQYVLQPGDTLGKIAQNFQVSLEQLISANQIGNPDMVDVGQVLVIPAPSPQAPGSAFKIIPDSELVYGPASITLDVFQYVKSAAGYLANYRETLDDGMYTGAEIILKVAREYSVNPRILLTVLEYMSGWVTRAEPAEETLDYPMLYFDGDRAGLYRQLSWAANQLNRGYYLWKVSALSHFALADNGMTPANGTINAGTAGVQQLMAALFGRADWDKAVGEQGVFATYNLMFGYPFDLAVEPVVPANLTQPEMQLPFETGAVWSFTGGPHAGWGDGSAWAAIDFAPPPGAYNCSVSNEWATAVASGVVVRSEMGVVVLDLDGDGLDQTGWSVLYLHIAGSERIPAGSMVAAGDRIGHPSCEGGISNGTHLHLARRYNGEWIPADGFQPFNLDGWISKGAGVEYNGTLELNGASVEAYDRLVPQNQISR